VIAWRTITGGHDVADVRLGAMTLVRLHARSDRWELEHLDGRESGPANSLGHAKRAALQALGELLGKAAFDVEVALRST